MTYLLCILLPPIGMIIGGKPFQALLCIVLCCTLIGWIPAAIWAVAVVADQRAKKRTERLAFAFGGKDAVKALRRR